MNRRGEKEAMASEPSSGKRVYLLELVARLGVSVVVFAFLIWQMNAPKASAIPAEYLAAENALRSNNLKQARRQLETLIARSPREASVYLLTIAAGNSVRRFDLSLEYGLRGLDACKYAPNVSRAKLCMAISTIYTGAQESAPQPNAQHFAHRALELDPDNPEILNDYGYILVENAVTLQEINVGLGYIRKGLQNLQVNGTGTETPQSPHTAADPSQELLCSAEDSEGWALYKRGRFDAQDYARAVEKLSQAIDDMPADAPKEAQKVLYYHLGAACRAASRPEEARHALQVALFYDPKYPEALKELNALPPKIAPQLKPLPVTIKTPNTNSAFRPLDKSPAGSANVQR